MGAVINLASSKYTVCTVKPVLSGHSKDQKLVFKTDYRLMQVKKYCRMLPLGALCNTFDLH